MRTWIRRSSLFFAFTLIFTTQAVAMQNYDDYGVEEIEVRLSALGIDFSQIRWASYLGLAYLSNVVFRELANAVDDYSPGASFLFTCTGFMCKTYLFREAAHESFMDTSTILDQGDITIEKKSDAVLKEILIGAVASSMAGVYEKTISTVPFFLFVSNQIMNSQKLINKFYVVCREEREFRTGNATFVQGSVANLSSMIVACAGREIADLIHHFID